MKDYDKLWWFGFFLTWFGAVIILISIASLARGEEMLPKYSRHQELFGKPLPADVSTTSKKTVAPYATSDTTEVLPGGLGLEGFAATQPLASYVGTVTPGAGIDLTSVTITTTVGTAVLVLANIQSIVTTGFTSSTNQVAFVSRDALAIGGAMFGYSDSTQLAGCVPFSYLDDPGVGTFTYHFVAATAGTYRDVVIQVIELKH